MEQWEYKVLSTDVMTPGNREEGALNALGREGWELVNVSLYSRTLVYHLKRQKRDATAYRG